MGAPRRGARGRPGRGGCGELRWRRTDGRTDAASAGAGAPARGSAARAGGCGGPGRRVRRNGVGVGGGWGGRADAAAHVADVVCDVIDA